MNPTRKSRIFTRLFLITCLTAAGSGGFAQPAVGQPAPPIALPNASDSIVQLTGLKGSVVLIHFWASWCGPCRAQHPHMLRLYKKYHAKGLEMLGISLDQDGGEWQAALKKDGLQGLQVIDRAGGNGATARNYAVDAIPATFLIDKKGILRVVDDDGGPDLESAIKKLLKE